MPVIVRNMADRRVFVSYSHKNRDWADLLFHDSNRTPHGRVFVRIDKQLLKIGADYDAKLREECEAADAFILLVSRDFLNSDYVKDKEWKWIQEQSNKAIWCWTFGPRHAGPTCSRPSRRPGPRLRAALATSWGRGERMPQSGARTMDFKPTPDTILTPEPTNHARFSPA